ncbi:MAG: hypothetical protein A2496_23790 [Burkholderiales bacterium RIFOXYC12_FULL_60_6]|nr:MAG: hypothetical protein A2496_23790 [Burkholderiales bacterium RIFOXYC12_FULL_60_6]
MRISNFLLTTSLLMGLSSLSMVAQAADNAISLTSRAQLEVEVVGKDGKKTLQRTPVEKAVPASEVIYTTTFQNRIDKPVGHIVINNPIPNNSEYQADSAFGKDCEILFSVDGGKSFAAVAQLKVKGDDGKERMALPGDYTHIRWIYLGQLMAGQSGEVGFRTAIK